MSRRSTMGPLAGSSAANIAANSSAADRRKSIGGSKARQSLAPGAAAASAANQRRQSLGRRSSIGARAGVGGADPRALFAKNFESNVEKLELFLIRHEYSSGPLSKKLLSSPSAESVRKMLEFLIGLIQPAKSRAFTFDTNGDGAKPWPEQALDWLKRLDFPFPVRKDMLTAPGNPTSSPAVVAMLAYLCDGLAYHEKKAALESEGSISSFDALLQDWSLQYYHKFLVFEDNDEQATEELSQRIHKFSEPILTEIERLDAKIQQDDAEIQRLAKAQVEFESQVQIRDAILADLSAAPALLKRMQDYLPGKLSQKAAVEAELAQRTQQLQSAETELAELKHIVARQEYTPLQVQEMLHQKATLEEALATQARQQEDVQAQIWAAEAELSKKVAAIEAAVAAFNETSAALSDTTHETGVRPSFVHSELRFDSSADTAAAMLNLDLKAHKEAVTGSKEALQALRKELAAELKRQAPALQALQEHESERAASVDALAKRSAKIHDTYSAERSKMHRDGEAACARVEDVELEIVALRNELAGLDSVEAIQAKQAREQAALAQQLAELHKANRAEERAIMQRITDSIRQVEQHKTNVHAGLAAAVNKAQEVRQQIADISTQ